MKFEIKREEEWSEVLREVGEWKEAGEADAWQSDEKATRGTERKNFYR